MPVDYGLIVERFHCFGCLGISQFVYVGEYLCEYSWWHHLLVWLRLRKFKFETGEAWLCLNCQLYRTKVVA